MTGLRPLHRRGKVLPSIRWQISRVILISQGICGLGRVTRKDLNIKGIFICGVLGVTAVLIYVTTQRQTNVLLKQGNNRMMIP